MNWERHGTGEHCWYSSGDYTIRRVGSRGLGHWWRLKHSGSEVGGFDTLTKSKRAAEIHATGRDPLKFYNWP